MNRHLVVVTAGLSQPSSTRLLADRLADAVRGAVAGHGDSVEVSVLELRELAVDLAGATITGGVSSPALERARRQVARADGLIAVTPVFSGSYSGLFKMFFDVLDPGAVDGMPVLIAATAGTARHSLVLDHALRPLFSYLHAVVVPTGVFAATEDFGGSDATGLSERIDRAAAQLAALLVAAPASTRSSEPVLPTPATSFSTLLRRHTG